MLLCAPYVSRVGANLVCKARRGTIAIGPASLLLTDLSPRSVCNGATDPSAIIAVEAALSGLRVVHLPRLHAKIYCADGQRLVLTSGNLTSGGINHNHECGVFVEDDVFAAQVEQELLGIASLGAEVNRDALLAYCDVATEVRFAYTAETESASRNARRRLSAALQEAEDTLIRIRLSGDAVHTVFARTIKFFLKRYGSLSTVQMHPLIQQVHPDLCDDSVDRVIEGQRFWKNWKHAVRTARQQLKKRGEVSYVSGQWHLLE